MIDIFLLLLIQLPLLQHLQFSSDFSSSSNAPPSTSYRQQLFNGLLVLLLHLSSNFPRASMTMLTRIDCQRRSSHSTPQHPPHLLLGVHFSSPPPTCQILSCLSRSIRPQIVLHLFYLVSLTHTLIHPISKVTYARTC